jgi:hypothetical protein
MNKLKDSAIQLFAEQGSDGAFAPSNESQVASDANAENSIGTTNDKAENSTNRAADFNRLINGEYKAEYQSALENALSKRLKTSNRRLAESQALKEQLTPLFEELAQRYSIEDASDIDAIITAAQNERTNESARIEGEFRARFDGWLREAEQTKQKYPSFDFDYESTNEATGEAFRKLLNSGIDVETAYTVIHKNEIMGGAMQYAYKTAKQEMADARTSRMNRPSENGTSQMHSSAIIDDISKLRPEQRKLIKAAVSRGEKVSAENFRRFL